MSKIEQRIERLESKHVAMASNLSLLTGAELEQRIDVLLEKMGTTREQVIAEHGSHKNFVSALRQRIEMEKNQHEND